MNTARWTLRNSLAVILLAASIFGSVILVRNDGKQSWSWYDPGWQVATVLSLASDGDLDLRNQLGNNPARAEDQTARGKAGEWYPVHEFLMPLLSVPFVIVFGVGGCLLFNYLLAIGSAALLVPLCARELPGTASIIAALLTICSPVFLEYGYSYSLDLFAALLAIIAFREAVQGHPIRIGIAAGFAVFGRVANVALLPALLMTPWLMQASNEKLRERPPLHSLMLIIAGGLPALLLMLACNWAMFGNPFESSFQHWVRWENGELVHVNQAHATFSRGFFEGLFELLFNRRNGIIATLPYLPLILFGLLPLWKANRGMAIFIGLVFAGYFSLLAKYAGFPGALGNRYLLPCVALSAIPFGYGLKRTGLLRD